MSTSVTSPRRLRRPPRGRGGARRGPASGIPAHTGCSGARGKDLTRLSFKFVGGPLEGTSFSHGQKVVRGGWVPRPSHKGLQPSWALRLVPELGGFVSAAHPYQRLGSCPRLGGVPGQLVNLVGGIGSPQAGGQSWGCGLVFCGQRSPPTFTPGPLPPCSGHS